MHDLARINTWPETTASEEFLRCCGVQAWAHEMARRRPFADVFSMLQMGDEIWSGLSLESKRQCFDHHPRIGDIDSIRKKFASTGKWAGGEQSGVAAASEETIQGLAQGNKDYEARFGHIFLICATGKSAAEMLESLRARLKNDAATELRIALEEQRKITALRLEKLLKSSKHKES